jgi:hypothetical protein
MIGPAPSWHHSSRSCRLYIMRARSVVFTLCENDTFIHGSLERGPTRSLCCRREESEVDFNRLASFSSMLDGRIPRDQILLSEAEE